MRKKAIIFGTGPLAELANFYLENDSSYSVEGFCETNPKSDTFCNKPLYKFEDIEEIFSPENYEFFVAIGYRKMNDSAKSFVK